MVCELPDCGDRAVTGSAAPKPPVVPDAPHGTLRGARMGCRCMWCRSAEQAATVTVTTIGISEGRTR